MLAALRLMIPAVTAAALPLGATAQEAYACTSVSICESPGPCRPEDGALRLLTGAESALVTLPEGHQLGLDRPVTLTERGPVRSFSGVTLLDTTMLLTQDRAAGTVTITEHARDAAGPVAITRFATCRPEEG